MPLIVGADSGFLTSQPPSFGHEPDTDVMAVLTDMEEQLDLKQGFLTLDDLLRYQFEQLSRRTQYPQSKMEMLQAIASTMTDMRTLGIQGKLKQNYEDESMYIGTPERPLYRTGNLLEDPLRIDLESPYSIQTRFYESDYDETSSLMRCDSPSFEHLPCMLDLPVDKHDGKFELYNVLKELRARHVRVSLNFRNIDLRLMNMKNQNRNDLDFLGKLIANSDLIRERLHDMKSEINGLLLESKPIKTKTEVQTMVIAEPMSILNFDSEIDVVCIRRDQEHLHKIETNLGTEHNEKLIKMAEYVGDSNLEDFLKEEPETQPQTASLIEMDSESQVVLNEVFLEIPESEKDSENTEDFSENDLREAVLEDDSPSIDIQTDSKEIGSDAIHFDVIWCKENTHEIDLKNDSHEVFNETDSKKIGADYNINETDSEIKPSELNSTDTNSKDNIIESSPEGYSYLQVSEERRATLIMLLVIFVACWLSKESD